MPANTETINNELFGFLKSHGYRPEMYASSGKTVSVPNEADVFQFTFNKDGKDYGKVTAAIDSDSLTLYYGSDVEDSPKSDANDSLSFDTLRNRLRRFAMKSRLRWNLSDENNLEHDMSKREYIKKTELNEGYHPISKKASYNDSVPSTKIILQHSRVMQEGDQRYRHIEKIFVENAKGERFLLPTNKPGVARVYARHIAEGGTPYDERGSHITSLVEEYTKMAGFARAVKNKQFNESAYKLINEGINHYQKLKETLQKMAGKRGYREYFENYSPVLNEDESPADLSEMFMQSSIDPRIEQAMPILGKLSKNVTESNMVQLKELEDWIDTIFETDTDNIPEKSSDLSTDIGEKELDESLRPGEYVAYKVFFDDGTTETLNFSGYDIDWDKVGAKRGKKVVDAKSMGGIQSSDYDIPKKPHQYSDDSFAQAQKKYDKQIPNEGLDANQKRAGQLGPTDKVKTNRILGNKPQSQKGLRGKLVGGESADPLLRLKGLSGLSE